jgi:hypothetical protein
MMKQINNTLVLLGSLLLGSLIVSTAANKENVKNCKPSKDGGKTRVRKIKMYLVLDNSSTTPPTCS